MTEKVQKIFAYINYFYYLCSGVSLDFVQFTECKIADFMQFRKIFVQKNLHISKKSSTFAAAKVLNYVRTEE